MRILLFEDSQAANLSPIALTRSVFELVCGRFSLLDRILRANPQELGLFVRDYLADVTRESCPTAQVNDLNWLSQAPTVVINGRWLPGPQSLSQIVDGKAGIVDDTVAWFVLQPEDCVALDENNWEDMFGTIVRNSEQIEVGGHIIRRPWDLINFNPDQLAWDFRQYSRSTVMENSPQVAFLGPPVDISVAPSVEIDPFVVIDARHGPVSIDENVKIQSFTRIEGPCHIAAGTQVFRALIREGTTIGPTCRVGGEIEESILHGFVNKYHEGFLGHSYVCPWVNLGAMTTNSDLKNDYSAVRVPLDGEPVDTASTKVGCFIGDHTKTAIDSMFNTGSSIGVMSMVLPGGELLPKFVPSFSKVWHGELQDGWELNRSIETARVCMQRRDQELTPAQEQVLRHLQQTTASARAAAISWTAKRREERTKG